MKNNKKIVTSLQAIKLGKKYRINFNIVPFDEWIFALNTELEHGSKFNNAFTNVTNDNLDLTARIAIAHLMEDPNYYYFLRKMEEKSERFWKKYRKPSIFL
jgi:CRISPR/Cas system-associated protein Cas10 (large subunit of type III CRISPR-Cas system)